jgi:UDPglucose 6-dehydrogenase
VAIDLAKEMLEEGASVKAHDPKALHTAQALLSHASLSMHQDPYETAVGADALVIATEWNEFKFLDWARIRDSMRTPIVFDGRNLLQPKEMKSLGFEYYSIGR